MIAFWKASRLILGGFWLHLGTLGGSPEMIFGCPEGSWGYLGASGSGLLGPAGALQAHYAHAQDQESRFKLLHRA